MSKYKTVKLINPKFFTECVDDVEYVVPICNEVNKAIEKAIEKMIKEDIKNKKINKTLQN